MLVHGNITALSLAADVLGAAEEFDLEIGITGEDRAGINVYTTDQIAVAREARITATLECETTIPLMATANGTAPIIAVTFTSGPQSATTYSGNFFIQRARHTFGRNTMQKVNVSLLQSGALTAAAVA